LGPPPVKCAPRSGFLPAAPEMLVLLTVFYHMETAHETLSQRPAFALVGGSLGWPVGILTSIFDPHGYHSREAEE